VHALVLGSAAGGGFPQWNCNCPTCRAARDPNVRAQPRTQSSLAVRGERGPWFLFNASPDLRRQLTTIPVERTNGVRSTVVAGVVLTDAEIDHSAGLLLLRESNEPLRIWSTAAVRDALSTGFPVLPMLERYCGVDWNEVVPGETVTLDGLEVEAFETGGDAPLYLRDGDVTAVGYMIRDGNATLTYAPGLAQLDAEIAKRFEASECVLVDGTFWTNDELVALGIATRDAAAMGHAPVSDTLPALSRLKARTILVHVNNTNPILLDDSKERATVESSGVEVGHDGMEIEL
jgi:pyrroloquinoline quinone biosynthesis protein B